MKIALLLSTLLLTLGFTNPSSVTLENATGEAALNNFQIDFVSNINNSDLEKRFEAQFPDIVADVTQINVHKNEESGYYYAVYGLDAEGATVAEYFKTTEAEVAAEEYDYIKMNEHTMQNLFARVNCREKTSGPWNSFCAPDNSGPICGVWMNGCCILY